MLGSEQAVATSADVQEDLPQSFDLAAYQSHPNNQDLAGLSVAEAKHHYEHYGRPEGRPASVVTHCSAFLALVPPDGDVLEIGPGDHPAFPDRDPPVRTLDAFTAEDLRRRMKAPELVPNIDVVWQGEPYHQVLTQQFDAVVGMASLDHQPCLITHLTYVSALLKPGARYFVALPDRRYGADHFRSDSTLPDVLDAFAQRRTRHSARSLAGPLFHGTHDDATRHWADDHGQPLETRPREPQHTRAVADILRQVRVGGAYLDARAWQFTLDSFQWLLNSLAQYGLSPFRVERLYPTVKPWGEFYAVLRIAV